MPQKTKVEIITAVDSIHHWLDDSLYVSGGDDNAFLQEYDSIFNCGIYNNLETGTIDPYGINYYSSDTIDPIIVKLLDIRPTDYEILVEWLNIAKKFTKLNKVLNFASRYSKFDGFYQQNTKFNLF